MEIKILANESKKIVDFFRFAQDNWPMDAAELSGVISAAKEGLKVEITPMVYQRTREQENYYRKWAGAFASFTGMTPDEMHDELLCIAYGSEIIQTRFGDRRRALKRSSGRSRTDYSTLIDTLIGVAADLEFVVPPPMRKEG